jgi:hypothetical protein
MKEGRGFEDTLTVDEALPCFGAHSESRFLKFGNGWCSYLSVGTNARLTISVTPQIINYVDVKLGLNIGIKLPKLPVIETTLGFEHESFMYNQIPLTGEVLESKRNGIVFSVAGVF